MSTKQYEENIDVARLAFWIKQTKNGKSFLSGFAEFEDGTKINLRIFKSDDKRNENSPDYFGKASVAESIIGEELALEEYEGDKRATKKPEAKKSTKKASSGDAPF
jgi:hypothetical protein